MQENLVIVESPAKAKTIEKFLGKDFIVKSISGTSRKRPAAATSPKGSNRSTKSRATKRKWSTN